MMLKVKFTRNAAILDVTNSSSEILILDPKEALGILDLKDEFHLLRLSEDSKRYCSILPYFGSTSYIYIKECLWD